MADPIYLVAASGGDFTSLGAALQRYDDDTGTLTIRLKDGESFSSGNFFANGTTTIDDVIIETGDGTGPSDNILHNGFFYDHASANTALISGEFNPFLYTGNYFDFTLRDICLEIRVSFSRNSGTDAFNITAERVIGIHSDDTSWQACFLTPGGNASDTVVVRNCVFISNDYPIRHNDSGTSNAVLIEHCLTIASRARGVWLDDANLTAYNNIFLTDGDPAAVAARHTLVDGRGNISNDASASNATSDGSEIENIAVHETGDTPTGNHVSFVDYGLAAFSSFVPSDFDQTAMDFRHVILAGGTNVAQAVGDTTAGVTDSINGNERGTVSSEIDLGPYQITSVGGGGTETNAERSAETHGQDTANATRSAELHGANTASSDRSAELTGADSVTSERAAEVTGVDTANAERSAEVTGENTANAERDAETTGVYSWQIQRNDDGAGWNDIEAEIQIDEVSGQYTYTDTGPFTAGVEYCYRVRNVPDDSVYSNIDCVTFQVGTGANAERAAEIHGQDTDNAERAAEVHGADTANAERSAETHGAASDNASRAAEVHGEDTATAERDAEVHGADTASAERAAEVEGVAGANAERAAELHGVDTAQAERAAETTGEDTATAERAAEVDGVAGANAERAAEIHGQNTATAERGAEIEGANGANASRAAEVSGIDTTSAERAAETHGQDTANAERAAEIEGANGANASRAAEVHGQDTASDTRAAEVHGQDTASAERAAEIEGAAQSTADRSAEIHGQDTATAERAAEISGQLTSSAERSAELSGGLVASAERAAEITGLGVNVSAERAAEITGQIIRSGQPATILTTKKQTTTLTSTAKHVTTLPTKRKDAPVLQSK